MRLTLVIVLGLASSARAQSPPTAASRPLTMPDREVIAQRVTPKVVLLGMEQHYADESWPAVERRLEAELRSLGLQVEREAGRAKGSEERLAELGARAAAHRALAAVRIEHKAGRRVVRVWLYDALTGKMLLRRIEIKGGGKAESAPSVALQAVDLLHASLIELRLKKKRELRKLRVPKKVTRLVAKRLRRPKPKTRDRWSVELGAGLNASPDIGPSWGVELGVALPLWRFVALTAGVQLPFADAEVRQGDDKATFEALQLRLAARLEPWRRLRLSPALDVGVMGLWGRAEGEAQAPKLGLSDSEIAVLPFLRLRVALRLTRALRLVAAAGLGFAIEPLPLRFSGTEVAAAGRPQFDAALLLEWTRRAP